MMIKPLQNDIAIDQVAQIIGEDYDSFSPKASKEDDAPKIEVHRKLKLPRADRH